MTRRAMSARPCDLVLFRSLAYFINAVSIRKLGCNAQLIVGRGLHSTPSQLNLSRL